MAFHPIEIKSGQTLASDFFDGLQRWALLAGATASTPWLVYGGDQALRRGATEVIPCRDLPRRLQALEGEVSPP